MSYPSQRFPVAPVFLGPATFPGGASLPDGSVSDDAVQAGAGVQASKLQHQHQVATWLCDYLTSAAVKRVAAHVVFGTTGTIEQFGVGATVPAGVTTSITVDLKKDGTSVLTSTVTLDNTTAANVQVMGALSVTSLAAGDVLEVAITAVTGSNLPKGVFTALVVREDAD